jgi:glyoxylate/hydroxypyruvate reductase A
MGLAIIAPNRKVDKLQGEIKKINPDIDISIYPKIERSDRIKMVVLWQHPKGIVNKFPNLRLISSLGAGVDHIIEDKIPTNVRITRIVDQDLTISMRKYIIGAVLIFHKKFLLYFENQKKNRWIVPENSEEELNIGVLGLGVLGQDVAKNLASLGFNVFGYSLTPKRIPNLNCFSVNDCPVEDFVTRVNMLICLVPLTTKTKGLINYELLRKFQKGSYLINVSRGRILVEKDLLRAIKDGYIRGAYLDVFSHEPLPPNHPFWKCSEIMITPHIASITNQTNAAKIIVENYNRMEKGYQLLYEVDHKNEY